MNYILHFHHTSGCIEYEIEDPIKQRLMDEDGSGDESVESVIDEDDDDDDMTPEEMDKRDEQRALDRIARKFNQLTVKPPLPWAPADWEYLEDIEELGVVSVYDEVGDLARYMNNLHVEMNKLKHTIDTLKLHYTAPSGAAADDDKKKSIRPGSKKSQGRSTTPQKSR